MADPVPILDYGDLFGQTLLFLAVVAAVIVGARTLSHALTRENAAHLLLLHHIYYQNALH